MYQQSQTCYKHILILPHKAVILVPAFTQIHVHLSYITYILQSDWNTDLVFNSAARSDNEWCKPNSMSIIVMSKS